MPTEKPFLNFQDYKTKLNEINSTGNQPQFNAESDGRVKKFLVDSVGSDDILRKVMLLNLVTEGAIPKDIADIWILKKLQKEI